MTRRRRSSSVTTAPAAVVAEFLGSASVTEEFVERWRAPGELRTRVWDEKFSEITYVPLGVQAWNSALASAGLTVSDVAAAAVVAPSQRVTRGVGGKLDGVHVIDDLSGVVGNAAAAQPGLLLAALLEQAEPGQVLGARGPRRRRRRAALPRDRRAGVVPSGASAGGATGIGRALAVRQVPRLAGHAPGRAAASPRTATGVGDRRGAERGLEVRVRRFPGA